MKKTKRSLLMSVVSLLLCFSMLLGSTLAWFTDSIASGSNVIQSGNLDLDVQYTLDGENWKNLDGANDLFQKGLWEPGHTEVVALRIENKGSLALKYKANMNIIKETIGKNKDGGDIVLSDILTVSTLTQQANQVGDISVMLAFMGESTLAYSAPVAFKAGNVLQSGDSNLLPGEANYVIVKVDMAETVGNEANHDGVNKPSIEFGINVLATQTSNESDSFGSDYDKNATFDDFANTNILATETKTLVAGEDSVEFALSNEGLKIANVSVPADAIADPTKPVTVTFDGIEPQITGENIVGYAYDIKVTNLKSGLAGDQLVTVVVEAPNALVAMQAYHNGVLIEDAVYDEVAGTITFKTASFSPYEFTSNQVEVSDLAGLRAALQKDGTTAKLMANITVDLTKDTGDARDPEHAYLSNGTPKYYNGVMINGKNVGLDLNGYNITAFCGEAYNSNSDVGALFFVGEEGSLNITNTGAVETGFIKMESSIYAVWAPYDSPSYVDIYGGAFIADSYAGDDIGTALDSNGNPDPVNGTMKNENTNRALIYAGFGGNMNVRGGYFLYNNTPNDTLDRNNGAFNAKDFYEGDTPLLTIHDSVMLINKEYRQNPANTSQPNGSYDNYSVKLAKYCEVVENVSHSVTIDGTTYATWCRVTRKELVDLSIDATTLYAVGQELNINKVTAKYNFGEDKVLSAGEYTISDVDMSFAGKKAIAVSYTEYGHTVTRTFTITVTDTFNSVSAVSQKTTYQVGETVEFTVSAVASDGTRSEVVGYTVSGADTSTAGIKTVTITFGNKSTNVQIYVVKNTSLDGANDQLDAHALYWYYNHQFMLGGVASSSTNNYNNFVTDKGVWNGETYVGTNGEVATNFNNQFAGTYTDANSPGGTSLIRGNTQYGLNITEALPYTYVGIRCIAGFDAKLIGFGYYVDGDTSTLTYDAPVYYSEKVLVDPGYQTFIDLGGEYTAEANTTICLSDLGFAAGSSHTITWVALFEDGYQTLADWTIKMKSSFGTDEFFKDTEKPNVNVIVLSGQSNAAGVSPITPEYQIKYSNINYKNIFMQYKNVGFDTNGVKYTMSENTAFETYFYGMGGSDARFFGPDAALAYYLATTPGLMDEQWFIIKYTAPGTGLELHWLNNNKLADEMMAYVENCIGDLTDQYDVQIHSLLWMQGENDALVEDLAGRYATNEQTLVSMFRNRFAEYSTLPNDQIPGSGISFISAGIAPAGKDGNIWTHATAVNNAKRDNAYIWYAPGSIGEQSALFEYISYFADNNVGGKSGSIINPNETYGIYNSVYIDTSLMSAKADDPAHYNAQSMEWLGTWFAQFVEHMMTAELPAPPASSEPTGNIIIFNANGGTCDTSTMTVVPDEAVTLPVPTHAQLGFICWFDGADYYWPGTEYTFTGNVTLIALWKATISFSGNTTVNNVTASLKDNKTEAIAGVNDTVTIIFTNSNTRQRSVSLTVTDSTGATLIEKKAVTVPASGTVEETFIVNNGNVTISISRN